MTVLHQHQVKPVMLRQLSSSSQAGSATPITVPQPGVYQHYKGDLYRVIGCVIHTETSERMVLYEAMSQSARNPDDLAFVRPLEMFQEKVEIDGTTVPRFKPVSA